jgi:hypothetical protein
MERGQRCVTIVNDIPEELKINIKVKCEFWKWFHCQLYVADLFPHRMGNKYQSLFLFKHTYDCFQTHIKEESIAIINTLVCPLKNMRGRIS